MQQIVDYIVSEIGKLVNIPSPSGYTKQIMEYIKGQADLYGFSSEYNKKGGLIITVPGNTEETIGLSAHADTLGAMVRSITPSGLLHFVSVGSFMMESIEGAYCKIHTRAGKVYSGTILTKSPSVHVQDDARTLERMEHNMEIRVDEEVWTKEDIINLGIENGDFISFDPEFAVSKSGFIKSRHLDDKACAAILLGFLNHLSKTGRKPDKTIKILISSHEELGIGASSLPNEIKELLVLDMGAVGEDLNGSESAVSICVKDSGMPYDYDMTTKLIQLAKQNQIDYAVDIFPHYGSDAGAAIRGGSDIRAALIGPGIHASHGMERTHKKALKETFSLLCAYFDLEY